VYVCAFCVQGASGMRRASTTPVCARVCICVIMCARLRAGHLWNEACVYHTCVSVCVHIYVFVCVRICVEGSCGMMRAFTCICILSCALAQGSTPSNPHPPTQH
jgi:hypothetical protein